MGSLNAGGGSQGFGGSPSLPSWMSAPQPSFNPMQAQMGPGLGGGNMKGGSPMGGMGMSPPNMQPFNYGQQMFQPPQGGMHGDMKGGGAGGMKGGAPGPGWQSPNGPMDAGAFRPMQQAMLGMGGRGMMPKGGGDQSAFANHGGIAAQMGGQSPFANAGGIQAQMGPSAPQPGGFTVQDLLRRAG